MLSVGCGMIVNESRNSPIQVSMSVWNKKVRLDIRHMYYDDDGEPHPTKRGVSVPEEDIQSLIEAIEKVTSAKT